MLGLTGIESNVFSDFIHKFIQITYLNNMENRVNVLE